jgi:D-3-phosphoglycerate dehydrogenase
MRIVAFDPYVSEDRARRIGVELGDLDAVLQAADFVTIHLPRTRETEGLIDAEALRRMKRGVRIVNVARGGIVDEVALVEAIEEGHVAGAAVDVFAVEPATDSPLLALPQVVVTPHLGASTHEAQDKAGLAVAEAVAAALSGDLVLSAVNLDLGPGASDEIRPFLPLAEHLGKIFVVFARGLPETLDVRVAGRVAGGSIKPIALGALKGALSKVTDEPVSYVNAPMLAEKRGMTVRETSLADGGDYATVLTISGVVGDVHRVIAGTVMERKGLVLLEIDGYEIEVPITDHMLLVRNDDVPGVIGRVGTVLGDAGVNIANMVVGRQKAGDAMMMALSIDGTIPQEIVDELLATPNVLAARFIDLS